MHLKHVSLSVLALAASAAAQRILEVEPNDTAATAQVVVPGNHVVGSLLAAEQDWYTFTLAAAGQVRCFSSGGVDVEIHIFDSTGTVKHAWNDGSSNADAGVTLAAGTYAARVNGYTTTTAGAYNFDLAVNPTNTPTVVEGAEPNDTFATATPVVLGDLVSGALSGPTDIDGFSFTITERSVIQIDVSDDSMSPQLDDTSLAFWTSADALISSTTGTSFSHRATLTSLSGGGATGVYAPGSYYFRVYTTTTPSPGYTGTGNYTIRTKVVSLPTAPAGVEGAEPNNTVATATPLALGVPMDGNITAGDIDWYSISLTGPTLMTFITVDGPATAITDTTIRLRDATGATILSSATTGGTGSHARMVITSNVAANYIVEVAGGLATSAGNYQLQCGSTNPNFVTAAYTVGTGGCAGTAGTPALAAELGTTGDKPVLGATHVARGSLCPAGAPVITMLGLSNTFANGGTVPLPYDLGGLGAPGCFVRVDPLATGFVIASGTGDFFWETSLPGIPGLRGLIYYQQFAVIDAGANVLGITTSNICTALTGDRYL